MRLCQLSTADWPYKPCDASQVEIIGVLTIAGDVENTGAQDIGQPIRSVRTTVPAGTGEYEPWNRPSPRDHVTNQLNAQAPDLRPVRLPGRPARKWITGRLASVTALLTFRRARHCHGQHSPTCKRRPPFRREYATTPYRFVGNARPQRRWSCAELHPYSPPPLS
jgi:hypothetical protein